MKRTGCSWVRRLRFSQWTQGEVHNICAVGFVNHRILCVLLCLYNSIMPSHFHHYSLNFRDKCTDKILLSLIHCEEMRIYLYMLVKYRSSLNQGCQAARFIWYEFVFIDNICIQHDTSEKQMLNVPVTCIYITMLLNHGQAYVCFSHTSWLYYLYICIWLLSNNLNG